MPDDDREDVEIDASTAFTCGGGREGAPSRHAREKGGPAGDGFTFPPSSTLELRRHSDARGMNISVTRRRTG